MSNSKSQKIKFIDLFAGIGGFHVAFHRLGLKCVFASEINKVARLSYETNFKTKSPKVFKNNMFNQDIYEQDKELIPDFDILCAGFPCQPFSLMGNRKGFDEDREGRGKIFFEIANILKTKRPKAFFLENVRHLISHDNGQTLSVIKETIENLNYSFYYKVIKASDFNLPQFRPRVFMVGFKNEAENQKTFNFPDPLPLTMTMDNIFNANCARKIGFTLRVGGGNSGIHDKRNWDRYYVNGEDVRIEPEHGKKMLGFPEKFFLAHSRTQSMKLLGNSIAVNAVYHVGKNLINHMKERDKLYLDNDWELKV